MNENDDFVVDDFVVDDLCLEDYEQLPALWNSSGIKWADMNTREKFARFLLRNPGLSSVCRKGAAIVGVVMCGEDGLRGYIYHVAVSPNHRRRGLGSRLAKYSLEKLTVRGYDECKLFCSYANQGGAAFWKYLGWSPREDVFSMTITLS